MNADILVDFFAHLITDARRRVFVILVNLMGRHARVVRAWPTKHSWTIEVLYLHSNRPEQSPETCVDAMLKRG